MPAPGFKRPAVGDVQQLWALVEVLDLGQHAVHTLGQPHDGRDPGGGLQPGDGLEPVGAAQIRETSLLLIPLSAPSALTRSSTLRVDTPCR